MPSRTLAEIERVAILAELQRQQYSVRDAAKALGIGKTTMYHKLNSYGLKGGMVYKSLCDEAARQMADFYNSVEAKG